MLRLLDLWRRRLPGRRPRSPARQAARSAPRSRADAQNRAVPRQLLASVKMAGPQRRAAPSARWTAPGARWASRSQPGSHRRVRKVPAPRSAIGLSATSRMETLDRGFGPYQSTGAGPEPLAGPAQWPGTMPPPGS